MLCKIKIFKGVDAYPVVFTLENVLIVLGTIVSLGFVASLIASSRVSKKLLE